MLAHQNNNKYPFKHRAVLTLQHWCATPWVLQIAFVARKKFHSQNSPWLIRLTVSVAIFQRFSFACEIQVAM